MTLLDRLGAIAVTRCAGGDPAHDYLHVRRVASNARKLSREEGAREDVTVAAALLHELWSYPKGHPDSPRSGEVCAEHAREVLTSEACEPEFIDAVAYAIAVHPYSRGIVPDTLEAKLLQDADRLDAIGAIGIARCFATCSEMRVPFYEPHDPFARGREPEDKRWGLDHFYKKLLLVPAALHTASARRLAEPRVAFLRTYLTELERELR